MIIALTAVSAASLKKVSVNVKQHLKGDTVIYKYNTVKAIDKSCTECYMSITYPVIKNNSKLKEAINHYLFDYTESDYSNTDFGLFFKKFAKTYKRGADDENNEGITETFDYNIKVQKQIQGFVAFDFADETSGGVHPNHSLGFLNWNTITNKPVKLDDIFIPGYKTRLTAIAKKIFVRNAAAKGFKLNDYTFDKGIFALNNNFKFTPGGLYFYYDFYEIQPYSAGPTELLIPYASIKQLLRLNTVITQYIK